MARDKKKPENWEPDIQKGLDEANRFSETKRELQEDADTKQRRGYNPKDSSKKKK